MGLDRDTTITWYGHSVVEIRSPGGKTILIDPWFGNPNSPKPPDSVDACDVMLLTHAHFDHFGECLPIASRTRPVWPAVHETSLWLGRNFAHKDRVIGMNKGGTVDAAGIQVTLTHADHSSGDIYGTAEVPIYFGEATGLILELENGFRIYNTGDTTLFSDIRLMGELYRPDMVILPIGGHFTMGPREAAMAVEWLGVRHVMPVHYGTFPVLAGTPDQLRQALADRGVSGVEVYSPEPGGSIS
jgi:L-ascorbate metabolism protein UlaG (beta-lactamase superfamily)